MSQPTSKHDILDYIDYVLHPIISPEYYAEYCVLHDMVENCQADGEWIYDGKKGRFPACKCSVCGHYENADWTTSGSANFCPNCGAVMK